MLSLLLALTINAHADSVFRIESPSAYSKPLDLRVKKISESPQQILLRQMCERGEYCLQFDGNSQGRAFLLDRPNQLLTSLHNIRNFLKTYWTEVNAQNLNDIPLPIQVRTETGERKIGGPLDRATVTVTAAQQALVMNEELVHEPEQDLVKIKLSVKIGQPLRLGEATPEVQILDRAGSLLPAPKDLDTFSEAGKQAIAFADYANEAKMSGAPVRNAQGEVLGVHTGELGGQSYFLKITAP